jgi:hypothetical protein
MSNQTTTGQRTASSKDSEPHLARSLSNRHIQLLAIGGAIGTGLFMGSGKTISVAFQRSLTYEPFRRDARSRITAKPETLLHMIT